MHGKDIEADKDAKEEDQIVISSNIWINEYEEDKSDESKLPIFADWVFWEYFKIIFVKSQKLFSVKNQIRRVKRICPKEQNIKEKRVLKIHVKLCVLSGGKSV